jgi:acyl carrier protein
VKGELWVGGDGVGRGYVGASTQTAERFVPDSYSGRIGARLYRTGDVVRWRESGVLEYLGRLDEQVKVRGYRIELGEVEAALRRHEGVRDSVVMAREDVPGEKRVVAYVVEQKQQSLTSEALRTYLKAHLPEYMIPEAFVILDALPRTANGKLDRIALPIPETGGVETTEYVGPRTPVEETLVTIWESLLHSKQVGVNDDFFQLGGHSLLAIQLVTRIREALGIEVSLRSIFDGPTVAGIAETIAAINESDEQTATPHLQSLEAGDTELAHLSDADVESLLATYSAGEEWV